jgi:rhodanese-related sulfurtransferase
MGLRMKIHAIPTMVSMIPSVIRGVRLDDLDKIRKIVRLAYPAVSQLSTATLAAWIGQTDSSVLIIDVRSAREYAVSHLRGAINVRSPEQIAAMAGKQGKTVLYCSVGFRSSRICNLLQQKGLPGCINLEGSIFQWANEGRELYQGEMPVRQVHPFGRRWAGLLKDGFASQIQ